MFQGHLRHGPPRCAAILLDIAKSIFWGKIKYKRFKINVMRSSASGWHKTTTSRSLTGSSTGLFHYRSGMLLQNSMQLLDTRAKVHYWGRWSWPSALHKRWNSQNTMIARRARSMHRQKLKDLSNYRRHLCSMMSYLWIVSRWNNVWLIEDLLICGTWIKWIGLQVFRSVFVYHPKHHQWYGKAF